MFLLNKTLLRSMGANHYLKVIERTTDFCERSEKKIFSRPPHFFPRPPHFWGGLTKKWRGHNMLLLLLTRLSLNLHES